MEHFLRPVELKLSRAQRTTLELAASIDEWCANNPLHSECKLKEDRLGFQFILGEFSKPAPTDEWGLIVGEIIHNLRSALDNLAYALSRLHCDPPERPKKIAFPICLNEPDFDRGKISQMPKEAAALVEWVQPFQRNSSHANGTPEQDLLIWLQRLNNYDKHQVPAVVLLAPEKWLHSFVVQFYSDDDTGANISPDITCWSGPIEPGVVLVEQTTTRPIKSIKGKIEGEANITLRVGDKALPIKIIIPELVDHTFLVVGQFRRFFQT